MSIYGPIEKIPMFAKCTVKEKRLLSDLNQSIERFSKGDYIIKEGQKSKATYPLYVIIQGSVLISKRGIPKPIATLKVGSTFGEMSFLSKRPRATNVIAGEKVLLMVMDKSFFKAIPVDLENKIKNYLIEVLIERLNHMNDSFSKISDYMNGLSYQLEKCGFK